MRRNDYLVHRLDFLWRKYFFDVDRSNNVEIKFGRKARKRLGSIRQAINSDDTLIIINGHFKDEFIPEYVIDSTIIHELCHYAHGFSSPLPQLSPFPHRGGLVKREFKKRGLENLLRREMSWLNQHWFKYLQSLRI